MPDLFLEFTSRQIRRFYGLYDIPEANHEEILGRWINVAAWLCEEHCILPVGFITECPILRRIMSRKRALFDGGLARISIRASSLGGWIIRRRDAYRPYEGDFADLYRDETALFIETFRYAFLDRRSNSAESLVDRWQSGPELSELWTPLKRLGAHAINRLSRIPEELNRVEAAIVWNGVSSMLMTADRRYEHELQRILQTEFVEGYCDEYDLETLHDLPYGWRELRRSREYQLALGYGSFSASLRPLGVQNLIERLAADAMVELRSRRGYLAFRDVYLRLANGVLPELRMRAAFVGEELGQLGRALAAPIAARATQTTDFRLNDDELGQLDLILAIGAERMQSAPKRQPIKIPRASNSLFHMVPQGRRIAIFVALDEERNIIKRSPLGFSGEAHQDHLVGEKDGVALEVYCAHGMGRVAAAVSTMVYLQERGKPDLLIVIGLAGGFEQAKLDRGAVLIPEIVFDLAIRKITADDTLFTPAPYLLDPRLVGYVRSNLFKEANWSASAHEFAEWPQDLRPNIRHDPITSVDEVVSSVSHADHLRTHYHKLAAVEMEAGGVCAAAKKFDVPVGLIRCVSDKADPSKRDDVWRPRAMKTIISLLHFVNLTEVLAFKPTS